MEKARSFSPSRLSDSIKLHSAQNKVCDPSDLGRTPASHDVMKTWKGPPHSNLNIPNNFSPIRVGFEQSLVEVLVLLVGVDCSNATLKWNMSNITRQGPIISDQVAEAAASDNLVPPLAWLACSWTPNHPRPFCLIGFVSEKKHFARLPSSLCRCFYTHPFWSSYRYFKLQTRKNVANRS